MTELQEAWEQIQNEKFNTLTIQKEDIMKSIYEDSHSTISLLKSRLTAKRNWCTFFLILFIGWFVFSLDRPYVLPVIGGLIGLYVIGWFMLTYFVRRMTDQLDYSEATLPLMKQNYAAITSALKYENLWGIVAFPLVIVGAILLRPLYDGIPMMEAIEQSYFIRRSLLIIVIAMPIMYWITNKMNNSAYGALIEKLQKNIHQMEMLG